MWVIRTKHTGKLFAARVDVQPTRPCVVVFETKQQAMQMRNMIHLMRPAPPPQPTRLTGNWLTDHAAKLKPPHQKLDVEKWSLASVLTVCNQSALDVVVIPPGGDREPVHYPANREYSEDVRFALDSVYMYGGPPADPNKSYS